MAVDLDLAKRLKTYRNFKHLTQKDVAAHLNVPHSAISDIENGKRNISIDILERVCNKLGVKISEFFIEVERVTGCGGLS